MTARILDVTRAEYFADPCETPSLSSSIARVMNSQSPLHAWQEHPRLGGGGEDSSTKATDNGSLLHSLILEDNADEFVVIDVADYKTKAAQQQRDEAIEEGKTPVKIAEYNQALVVALQLRKRIEDIGIKLTGQSEIKVEWTEQFGNEDPVLCRGMMDHLVAPTIYDLKITRAADLKSISRHIIEYGYDIQGAAYSSALSKLQPRFVGRTDFILVFAEAEKPFAVTPVRFDGQLRRLGELKWEFACMRWAQCLRTGVWPGYVDQITSIEAPPWALSETHL